MKQYATRFCPLLLALMLLSLAACSGGTTASAMHLRRIEGTVSVSDGGGKDVPVLENLGLYSGYGVGTRSASYAWIDLDDVKLAKLDQDSEITIEKEGKALDITLKSGSLFFNVSEPLEDDETMNIRTSTMLVGIRGTCGWVEERDGLSRVYLLEGKVECSAGGRTVQISAGEMAALMADGKFLLDVFPAGAIPDFVRDDLPPDMDGGAGGFGGMDDPPGPDGPAVSGPGSGEGQTNYEPGNGDDFLEALRSAKDGDTITLTKDIEAELADDLSISGGSKDDPVVLDLNGHTLTVTRGEIDVAGFKITGALRVRDSSGDSGVFDHPDTGFSTSGSGHLFMDSGTINGSVAHFSGGEFMMTGGTISGTVQNYGEFTMSGGTINGTLANHASFTMAGGTINGACQCGGDATMNGGTINGSVQVDESNAVFTMNGGVIDGGTTQKSVLTVRGDNSIFIMNGGEITADSGSAVLTRQSSQIKGMILNGGTITNNGTGHALFAYGVETLGGTVFRTKNPEICVLFGEDGYRIGPWRPDGYAAAETPDAEGYYYMTKA